MSKKVFIIAIVIFICDQLTKGIVTTYLNLNEKVIVLKNFFNITFINNYGASWGLLKNNKYILIILSIISILILIRYINMFKKNTKNILGLGFIIGGIIGNLSDRILYGYIRDFLDFKIFGYNYPIFNLADSFIVIGVFLLIIAIIKGEDKNGSKSRNKRESKNRCLSEK